MRIYIVGILFFAVSCAAKKSPVIVNCINETKSDTAIKMTFHGLFKAKEIDGKEITIRGYFAYYFEDVSLYRNRSSPDEKGIWLDFNTNLFSDSTLRKLNGKEITVTGTVDLSQKGHLGSFFCTLTNIICVKY